MESPAHDDGRTVRVLLAMAGIWLVLAIFPLTRDITLIKLVGYQALVSAGALLTWRAFRNGGVMRLHAPLTIPALVLAVSLLVAVPFATNPGFALMEWSKLAVGFVAFFLAMQSFREPRQFMGLLAAVAIALTLASLYGLVQWLGWDPFPWGATTSQELALLRRAPATYGNPNLAAHAIVLGIPLALLLVSLGQRWAIACLPILLFHLALNGTRGAAAGLMLALALVVAVWGEQRVFRERTNPDAARWPAAAGILASLLVAMAAAGAVSLHSLYHAGTPVPQDTTLTLRFHSMHGAVEMIRERPVLGRGPGHFVIDNAPYWSALEQERYAGIGRRNTRVHNEPLDLSVQGGVLAGAAYLSLLLFALATAIRMAASDEDRTRRRTGMAMAAVFMAFFVDGLFGFNLHAPVSGGLIWLLLGAFAGLHARPWPGWRTVTTPRVAATSAAVALLCLTMGAMAFTSSFFAFRGDGALYHGEPVAARASYLQAARFHPWDWRVQQSLGGLMLEQTYHGNAVRHFEEALALHPNDPRSLTGLGRARAYYATYLESEGMDGVEESERLGLEAAEQAARLAPGFTEAALVQALIMANQSTRARFSPQGVEAATRAEEAANRLLALGHEPAQQAWQLLANARAARDDSAGTIEAFSQALVHGPGNAMTWDAYQRFAHGTASFTGYLDSIRWREERLRLEAPGEAADRAALAMRRAEAIAAGYDSPAQVRVALAEAAGHDPMHPGLWPYFYAFAARFEEFLPAFRTSVEEAARRLETVAASEALPVRVAGLAAQGGDALPSAVENCFQVIAHDRGQGRPVEEVREAYGWVWAFLAGEADRAALSDELSGLVRLRLGMAADLLGDDALALAMLEEAVPLLPLEPKVEALRQIGAIAMRLERVDTALESMREAARIAPSQLAAQLDLARALAAAGQTSEARRAYHQILASFQFDAHNRARLEAELEQLAED